MYSIEVFSPRDKGKWNDFIQSAENGHFMFLRSFMDYHKDRFLDNSLLIFDQKKLKALLPANLVDDVLYSHQGLTFGGLILSPKTSCTETTGILDAVIDYAREHRISRIVYKAIPDIFHARSRCDDLYALHKLGFKLFRRDLSSVLDLRLSLKYRSTKKQNIKKAVLAGLEYSTIHRLEDIWDFITQVLEQRHGVSPTHSLYEIQGLMDAHPDNIKAYSTSDDDGLLSCAVVFLNNECVHTQYLATNGRGRNVGALDFLLDRLIGEYKDSHGHFSFGISTEDGGKVLNTGLAFQKEGFGARGLVHDFYRLELG